MTRAAILALFLALLALGATQTHQPAIAICDTDSDCINHCPANDGECDGGPQP